MVQQVMRGLYAIADADSAEAIGLDWLRCAQAMLAAEVPILQLRAKGRGAGEMTTALRSLLIDRGPRPTILIQNDRADVADLCGADGVHVGQDDLSVSELKRVYPHLRSGLSTHSIEQLRAALSEEPPSYLAFGPIFRTQSKINAEPDVGVEALRVAYRLCSTAEVPLVAIGGIGEEQISEAASHAHLIAAISLLLPPPGIDSPYQWIERRCRDIHKQIQGIPLSA